MAFDSLGELLEARGGLVLDIASKGPHGSGVAAAGVHHIRGPVPSSPSFGATPPSLEVFLARVFDEVPGDSSSAPGPHAGATASTAPPRTSSRNSLCGVVMRPT